MKLPKILRENKIASCLSLNGIVEITPRLFVMIFGI
jgi:hypothetical protein